MSMPRLPVAYGLIVSPYGDARRSTRLHWGVDLGGVAGTQVVAPEDLLVVRTWLDDATPPFVGYGPGGVLARGTDIALPGKRYHLLAHLDPSDLPEVNRPIREGAHVGVMSDVAHVHWEIRREPIDDPATRQGNTIDPIRWVDSGGRSRAGGVVLVVFVLWMLISRR